MTLYRALLWLCAALLPGGVLLVPLLVFNSARRRRQAPAIPEGGAERAGNEAPEVVGVQP